MSRYEARGSGDTWHVYDTKTKTHQPGTYIYQDDAEDEAEVHNKHPGKQGAAGRAQARGLELAHGDAMLRMTWDQWKWVLLVAALIGVGVGSFAYMRKRKAKTGPDGTPTPELPPMTDQTPAQRGREIAAQYLIQRGCALEWAPGQGPSAIAGHVPDFVVPAIAWARQNGATGVAGVTNSIYGLLMPGCGMPSQLDSFDLDKAVARQLMTEQQVAFDMLRAYMPNIQLYLTLRGLVIAQGGAK